MSQDSRAQAPVGLGTKRYAPETAVGTGAAEPLVDEYEAAKAVPSVDESTLDGGRSQNFPASAPSIDYSNQIHVEASEGLESEAAANDTNVSNGEDYEVANKDNDDVPLAGAQVGKVAEDSDVNAKAEDTRPEVPQADEPRKTRAKK